MDASSKYLSEALERAAAETARTDPELAAKQRRLLQTLNGDMNSELLDTLSVLLTPAEKPPRRPRS